MIDEDPFPQVESINIVATNFRAILNEQKVRKFFQVPRRKGMDS